MKKVDLLGLRFGKLTVVALGETKYYNGQGKTTWNCVCDCGNFANVVYQDLSKNAVKSCGCLNFRRKPIEITGFKRVLNSYKTHAKTKNREFLLSDDEFRTLIHSNCFYCDAPPANVSKQNKKLENVIDQYVYNGIDRKDPKIGYINDNCVSCCKRCNLAKNELSFEAFVNWISRVFMFQCTPES